MAFPIMRRIKCAKYASLAINAAWRGFPFGCSLSPFSFLLARNKTETPLGRSSPSWPQLAGDHGFDFVPATICNFVCISLASSIVIFREFLHVLAFHLHRSSSFGHIPYLLPCRSYISPSCLLASSWSWFWPGCSTGL